MDGNYNHLSRRSEIWGTLIQTSITHFFSFYFMFYHTHLVRYSKVVYQMIKYSTENLESWRVEFLPNTWMSKLIKHFEYSLTL